MFLPREFQKLDSPWGHNESDTTKRLSLSLLNITGGLGKAVNKSTCAKEGGEFRLSHQDSCSGNLRMKHRNRQEKWAELSHFSGKKDTEETVDEFLTVELTSQRPGHPALPSVL